MVSQNVLTVVLVVLIVVAGVVGYFAGSSAAVPRTVTVTSTVAPSVITTTVTKTEKVTITETVTPKPTPTVTPPPPTPPPYWPKEVVFRTYSVGSPGYVLAGAIASLAEKELGIKFSVQPGASAPNLLAVANGEVEIGFTHVAWIPFAKDPNKAVKVWGQQVNISNVKFVLGPTETYVVLITKRPDFPVNSIKELAEYIKGGKAVRLAVGGPAASLEDFLFRWLLEKYGVTEDIIRRAGGSLVVPGEAQAVESLIGGKIDLIFDVCALPSSNYIQLETRMPDVKTIELTDEDIDYILNTLGFKGALVLDYVPKETYKFLAGNYRTLFTYTVLIAKADLPNDLVYQIARIVSENKDYLVKAVAAFRVFDPTTAWKFSGGLEIHPGAKQYYIDKGYLK
ncbi:MAG: TAXI family TRAP transporter solute-binding subunit [Desulfurococcaceae archaeon]|nr:TAXI family TRAP transporter solute-binding subunit [Desulfurococcaceae archaeon]